MDHATDIPNHLKLSAINTSIINKASKRTTIPSSIIFIDTLLFYPLTKII